MSYNLAVKSADLYNTKYILQQHRSHYSIKMKIILKLLHLNYETVVDLTCT